MPLPRDRFKTWRERAQWRTYGPRKPSFSYQGFRKCPSCKQPRVSIKKLETKVVVLCNNCFLEYVFVKYPVFEDVDYYNKMRDTFREDVRNGKVIPTAVASPKKIVGRCPLCNLGSVAIIERHARGRIRKRFLKCGNSKCQRIFLLPYKGDFEPAHETCPKCGWPALFWEFRTWTGGFALYCFNIDCRYRSKWKRYAK